jgi:AraC-like DNA-binding protein
MVAVLDRLTPISSRRSTPNGGTARIRAVAASGLCHLIGQLGAEPDSLLREVQLSQEDLSEPLSWLFLADYCRLFEHAARAFAEPTFGLGFGLVRSTAILGDLGSLAASAPTLHAAFDALARYMPTLQEQSTLRLEPHADRYKVAYQIRDGHIVRRRQDAELTLGMLIGLCRASLGPNWVPQEVHFEHPRADAARDYDNLLGAPVYFGQICNALVLTADDVGTILQSGNPARFADLERRLSRRLPDSRNDDFIGIVLQEIRDALAKGNPGIEPVARRLDMSGPALYRRLKSCGVEFSDLQRDLRREIALMHVAEAHIPLTEVALLLGYSELSAFSRAFRAWTGTSAIAYRRRCRPAAAAARSAARS